MTQDGQPTGVGDGAGNGEEEGPRRGEPAEELFAEWLIQHPRSPWSSSAEFQAFQSFQALHPGVADELGRLWQGLGRYERARVALLGPGATISNGSLGSLGSLEPPTSRSPRLRRVAAGLLAAAAIVGIVGAFWVRYELDRMHGWTELANAAAATARRFAEGLGEPSARVLLGERPPSETTVPETAVPAVKARCAEAFVLFRGASELSEQTRGRLFVRSADRAMADATARGCTPWLTASAASSPVQRALLEAMVATVNVSFRASPLALALRKNPAVERAMRNWRVRSGLPKSIASAISAAADLVPIELRVIDLDAGGSEFVGASVWVQAVEFPSNEVGEPQAVGRSPWSGTLVAGDWRITVGDAERKRHSELRVPALPGQDLGIRVAFLRSTESVIPEMAYKPAARIHFSDPKIVNRVRPEAVDCDVDELWVDRFEVSKARWAAFHRDLQANGLRWFDGAAAVRTLRFLDAAGECPPQIADRPVTDAEWAEAVLFANWEGKRLPTEREWERIAEGPESRTFAWGDDFREDAVDATHSIAAAMIEATKDGGRFAVPELTVDEIDSSRVDDPAFDAGATPEGDGDRVYRLGDNVSEMTEDPSIERLPDGTHEYQFIENLLRVGRGASFLFAGEKASASSFRLTIVVGRTRRSDAMGFRCVKGPFPR